MGKSSSSNAQPLDGQSEIMFAKLAHMLRRVEIEDEGLELAVRAALMACRRSALFLRRASGMPRFEEARRTYNAA